MFTSFWLRPLACLVVLLPISVLAAGPIVHDPQRPYEPLPVDAEIEKEQLYLGELTGDPHMYEVSLTEEKEFSIKLLQLDLPTTTPFSFILVRDNGNNRGVSEIGRVRGQEVVWKSYRDSTFALRFKQGLEYSSTLSPGVYRFEISTPDNFGKYLIILGTDQPESGYFEDIGYISAVQRFFDYSALRIMLSSYVLYPIGSVIIIILIMGTWYMTRRPKVITAHNA